MCQAKSLHQAGVGITFAVLEPEHRFFVHNIAHLGPAEATKQIKLWDELITVNDQKTQDLHNEEICGLIRGLAGGEVTLGFQRKTPTTSIRFSVIVQRKLSSTFGPDLRSVSWQNKDKNMPIIVLHPSLHGIVEHLRHQRDSILGKVFKEQKDNEGGLASDSAKENNSSSAVDDPQSTTVVKESDLDDETIMQLHAEFLYRNKYFLIL
uniref:PDZ domain-containing protein n=1 Tax=Cryptomonas curvata TaxID=233186 RepID=A0A7S0QJ29_9CRYP|mmetsp:Transcript_27940/g.58162  ORF Transcript_27940/g.58162 Transcript_27940/m.58162 type:complete len:208 (+) Transcript_27940:218-841(+)